MKFKKMFGVGIVIALMVSFSGCDIEKQKDAYRHIEEGDAEAAVREYKENLKVDKDKSEAYMGLSLAYFKNTDYDKCIKINEEALKEKNTDKAILLNRTGIIYIMKDDKRAALDAFNEGLKKPQINKNVEKNMMWNRIILSEDLGEYEKARDYLKKYLLRFPKDEDAVREAMFFGVEGI